MLSWILLILLTALFSAIGFVLSARLFGRGERLEPLPASGEVIEGNRRALGEGRLDDVTFDVVHRGYRMDQVDALIEELAARAGLPATPAGPRENGVDCYETETSRA